MTDNHRMLAALLCLVLIGCIAYTSHRMHTPKETEVPCDTTEHNRLRMDYHELELQTLEDSIHFYEDGI